MGSSREENFCLRWNDFESNLSSAFLELRNDADLCDVTLATDEDSVGAHKLVLSACSPQLKEMIRKHIRLSGGNSSQNMMIYLRGVRHADLVSVLEFMYCGSVNVAQEDLNSFLAVAEDLKVKGLTQNSNNKELSGVKRFFLFHLLHFLSKGITHQLYLLPFSHIFLTFSIMNV